MVRIIVSKNFEIYEPKSLRSKVTDVTSASRMSLEMSSSRCWFRFGISCFKKLRYLRTQKSSVKNHGRDFRLTDVFGDVIKPLLV
jgi:hypothetical protein